MPRKIASYRTASQPIDTSHSMRFLVIRKPAPNSLFLLSPLCPLNQPIFRRYSVLPKVRRYTSTSRKRGVYITLIPRVSREGRRNTWAVPHHQSLAHDTMLVCMQNARQLCRICAQNNWKSPLNCRGSARPRQPAPPMSGEAQRSLNQLRRCTEKLPRRLPCEAGMPGRRGSRSRLFFECHDEFH